MILDRQCIDVLHIERGYPVHLTHTDKLPFSMSSDSPGLKCLIRALSCPLDKLGYVPPVVPEPFQIHVDQFLWPPGSQRNKPSRTKCNIENFVALREGSLSLRQSSVYLADCKSLRLIDKSLKAEHDHVVVKFFPDVDGHEHESTLLHQFQSQQQSSTCLAIPRSLAVAIWHLTPLSPIFAAICLSFLMDFICLLARIVMYLLLSPYFVTCVKPWSSLFAVDKYFIAICHMVTLCM